MRKKPNNDSQVELTAKNVEAGRDVVQLASTSGDAKVNAANVKAGRDVRQRVEAFVEEVNLAIKGIGKANGKLAFAGLVIIVVIIVILKVLSDHKAVEAPAEQKKAEPSAIFK